MIPGGSGRWNMTMTLEKGGADMDLIGIAWWWRWRWWWRRHCCCCPWSRSSPSSSWTFSSSSSSSSFFTVKTCLNAERTWKKSPRNEEKWKLSPQTKTLTCPPEIPWIGTVLKGNVIFQPSVASGSASLRRHVSHESWHRPAGASSTSAWDAPEVEAGEDAQLEAWQMVEWNNYSFEN